jgi:type III pantothenate kinase
MLLTIDVGNSNTVLGLFAPVTGETARYRAELTAHWRITTPEASTSDEFGVLLRNLFDAQNVAISDVTGIAIASVVPPLDSTLRQVCETYFGVKPLLIEPGVKTGVPVLTDNPAEAGADRIMNCVAAYDRFRGACIIVDMGTATTFDVVSAKGEFVGGAIAPGLGISAEALFRRAARLPRIEVKKPTKVIGTGTVDNIQIGLYYGYIGLVDGILERMLEKLHEDAVKAGKSADEQRVRTIATGGLAGLIAAGSKFIEEVDDVLTLTGLRLTFERNEERAARPDRPAKKSARNPAKNG